MPVVKYQDTAFYRIALGFDSFEEMRDAADKWAKEGVPGYRNVNKQEDNVNADFTS